MPIRSPLLFPISSSLSFTAAGGREPLLVFVCVCVLVSVLCAPASMCVSSGLLPPTEPSITECPWPRGPDAGAWGGAREPPQVV